MERRAVADGRLIGLVRDLGFDESEAQRVWATGASW